MDEKEQKGASDSKPRYVWDPKKLAWVETTEVETAAEAVPEKAAVAPTREEEAKEAAAEPTSEEGLKEATVGLDVEGVAGEAVVEGAPAEKVTEAGGLQYRGAGIRLLAFIVDIIVLLVILVIVSQVSGIQNVVNTASDTTVTSLSSGHEWIFIVVLVVYFMGFWAWRGQTPGKMLLKARIVKTNGSPIGIVRAVLRFVVYFLYLLVWGFTGSRPIILVAIIVAVLIIIAFNKRKRGIHDFIAGTVVINSRPPKPAPVEVEAVDSTEETAEPPGASESDADKPEREK